MCEQVRSDFRLSARFTSALTESPDHYMTKVRRVGCLRKLIDQVVV